MGNFLKSVKGGPVPSPFKIVLYGLEGVGKSSFAADAPSPIFLDIEGGTEDLDVMRMPKAGSYRDVLAMVDELGTEKHEFKTLVIDTADWLEGLIWKHVCQEAKVESIEDIGYGKGYTAALEHWRGFLGRLEALRTKRGMNIIILAHSHIRGFRNPAGEDYERYELKLNAKAASLIKEWPSAVLFANYEVFTVKSKDSPNRVRAVGEGSRVVHTEPRPAWDAKNRYGLPEQIGLNWAEFEEAARARTPVEAGESMQTLEDLKELCPPALKAQIEAGEKRAAGDPVKLAKLTDWTRGKLNKTAA